LNKEIYFRNGGVGSRTFAKIDNAGEFHIYRDGSLQNLNTLIDSSGGGGGSSYTFNSPLTELNGSVTVDLSSKQDTLTAGEGIDITNNVISSSLLSAAPTYAFCVSSSFATDRNYGENAILEFNSIADDGFFVSPSVSHYNFATFKYTIPVAGIWSVGFRVYAQNVSTDDRRMAIFKNGAWISIAGRYNSHSENMEITYEFAAGDIIDVRTLTGATYHMARGHSYFYGNLISNSGASVVGANTDVTCNKLECTNLTVNDLTGNSLSIAPDTNIDSIIGKCRVGSFGHSDVAAFGHQKFSGSTEYGVLQNSDGRLELNSVSGQEIGFRIGNVIKMTINENGVCQFGASNVYDGRFYGNGFRPGLYCDQSYNGNSGGFTIFQEVNNTLTVRVGNGTTRHNKMYIRPDDGVLINNFTGQHRCFVDGDSDDKIGRIVSSNKNKYVSMEKGVFTGIRGISINESLPNVGLSTIANDKAVFGVISSKEDEERFDTYGTIQIPIPKEKGDTRYFINSVGEGAIWVCNKNGNLEAGDYISSSGFHGYGKKQSDDIMHNYTVAKITMDCNFTPNYNPVQELLKDTHGDNVLDENGNVQWCDTSEKEYAYKVKYVDSNDNEITQNEYYQRNDSYICAFVGCTYHCG
jgi:hypothetical protein